jgi:hypothetical protein
MRLPSIYLTSEELQAITGRVRPSAQVKWFRANGFTVLERADGMPLVSRAHFELVMGGVESHEGRNREVEPDYDSL